MKNRSACLLVSTIAASLCCAAFAQEKKGPPTTLPTLPEDQVKRIEAAVPTAAAVKPAKERKVLVFWRCEGFYHKEGIAGGTKAIQLMGEKTGAFKTDVAVEYSALTADNLAQYDVLVLNNTTTLKLPADAKKALLDFVRNGKGMVGIHAATDNFYDWPEGAQMMGGLFDGHPWGGGGTWAFKLDEPNHVLNQAFAGKNYKLKDEIYQYKAPYTRADRRVLITLDLDDATTAGVNGKKRQDNDYAVAWIKQFGQGRVFFCGMGHSANVFWDKAVDRFLCDGIQYALGDLKADATPK